MLQYFVFVVVTIVIIAFIIIIRDNKREQKNKMDREKKTSEILAFDPKPLDICDTSEEYEDVDRVSNFSFPPEKTELERLSEVWQTLLGIIHNR